MDHQERTGGQQKRESAGGWRACTIALLVLLLLASAHAQPAPRVSAYYAGWQSSHLPPDEIDFSAITQLIHFSIYPTGGATFDGTGNGMTPSHMAATVQAAHAAGKKIILCVGGYGADFRDAVSAQYRDQSIANLVSYLQTYGYDGLDIDWEPVQNESDFLVWIVQLRQAMLAVNPAALLTDAAFSFDQAVVDAQASFDQINLMTYDMAGPWPGWVTWHNSPIYDGGFRFPSTGGPPPSADGSVNEYLAAGVPKAKLGIGTDFLGYYWTGGDGTPTGGVTAPRQSYTTTPSVRSNVQYYEIMDTYEAYPQLWDSSAQAAYISIDRPGSANDMFISFDGERTMYAKAAYIRSKGIGGVIIFELGAGYRSDQPDGQKDLLLQAVKNAFILGQPFIPDTVKPTVSLVSPAPGSTVAGTVTLSANASDNSGIVSVQFFIDGTAYRSPMKAGPFQMSVNTWKLPNGSHTVTARAQDRSGNADSSSAAVTVHNVGTPPVVPPMVVYDETIHAPFINSSWSCTTDPANTAIVRSGSRVIRVDYLDWGALDFNSGQWTSLVPIDPLVYDTLQFDVYPLSSFDLTVGFYNGTSATCPIQANQWNHVVVPLNFLDTFTRFDMQRNLSGTTTAYFDNIQLTGFGGAPPAAPPDPDTTKPKVTIVDPANGATVSGSVHVGVNASDNIGVVGIQYTMDGTPLGQESQTAPYSISINSWYQCNGQHTLTAVARDGHGNLDSSSIAIKVSNHGAPPNFDMRVYDDSLDTPFQNDSWGATVDFSSTEQACGGTRSARVDFTGWGAMDLLSGTWGALVPISPSQFDSLTFDVYPTSAMNLEICFYTPTIYTVSVPADVWTHVSIPLGIDTSFTRFYFRRNDAGSATAYFDNIRFEAFPPAMSGCASTDMLPATFSLGQNFPNPFNPSTTIQYSLPVQTYVRLTVFDVLGRKVQTLVDGVQEAGTHSALFGAPGSGPRASGMYYYRIETGTFRQTKKMILLK